MNDASAPSPAALALVRDLRLEAHPEGGWFRRTWTAPARLDTPRGERASASAILFLLDHGMEARWHLVHSDELWLWHGPGALEISLGGTGDAPSCAPERVVLGAPGTPGAPADDPVQVLVPAGTWQRTIALGSHALASCIVSPEFSYEDWTLAEGGA